MKYKIKQQYEYSAIGSWNNEGLWFSYGLALKDKFMSSNNNWAQLSYYGKDEPKYEILNDESNFIVKQLYVYQISFE